MQCQYSRDSTPHLTPRPPPCFCPVTPLRLQTKSGVTHTGVFVGVPQQEPGSAGFGVVLRFAQRQASGEEAGAAGDALVTRPVAELTVSASDFVSLRVSADALTAGARAGGEGGMDGTTSLETDAAIGSKRVGRAGRSLVAWQPEESDAVPQLASGLCGGSGGGGNGAASGGHTGKWDQFSANQAQFGVISTFNEELYTTKLDKSQITGISEEEAARIAAEIEGQSSRNFHLAEERGQALGADDDDEEARFSAVIRGEGDAAEGGEKNDETFGEHTPKSLDDKPAAEKSPAAAAPEPKKLGLNPNAKPFSFSPTAKPFVPGGGAATAPAAPPMPVYGGAPVYGGGYPGAGGMRPPYGMAPGMGLPQMALGPGGYPMMMLTPQGMQMAYAAAPPQAWAAMAAQGARGAWPGGPQQQAAGGATQRGESAAAPPAAGTTPEQRPSS